VKDGDRQHAGDMPLESSGSASIAESLCQSYLVATFESAIQYGRACHDHPSTDAWAPRCAVLPQTAFLTLYKLIRDAPDPSALVERLAALGKEVSRLPHPSRSSTSRGGKVDLQGAVLTS
jgi:hypothetical protein